MATSSLPSQLRGDERCCLGAGARRLHCWPHQGAPTHELQRLGAWKTGAMVERYVHVAPEALQGAA